MRLNMTEKEIRERIEMLPVAERARYEAALVNVARQLPKNPHYALDPLNVGGTGLPHIKQDKFLTEHEAWFRFITGLNRGGKTIAAFIAMLTDVLPVEMLPEHLLKYKKWGLPGQKPFRAYVIVNDDATIKRVHMGDLWSQWCPQEAFYKGSLEHAWNASDRTLKFANGAEIYYFTHNQQPRQMQGAACHRIWWDEEPVGENGPALFMEALMRIRDYQGDMIASFTMLDGLNKSWMYKWFLKPHADKVKLPDGNVPDVAVSEDGIMVVRLRDGDNPVLPKAADDPRMKMLGVMSPQALAVRVGGDAGQVVGTPFEKFDQMRHVISDEEAYERSKRCVERPLGVDPGGREQAVFVRIAQEADGTVIVYALQVFTDYTIIDKQAEEVHSLTDALKRIGVREPSLYIGDKHALPKMDGQTGFTDQQAYWNAGLPIQLADARRVPGWARLRTYLAANKLLIAESCVELIEQLIQATWRKQAHAGAALVADIEKVNDHCLDALRYAIMTLLPLKEEEQPLDPFGGLTEGSIEWMRKVVELRQHFNPFEDDEQNPDVNLMTM